MSLRAFVTGASGFVGSHLVRELHRQEWEVFALVRPSSRLQDIRDVPVQIRSGDITDAASVLETMPERTDAVFHVAASTNVWSGHNEEQQHINVDKHDSRTIEEMREALAAKVGENVVISRFSVFRIGE